MVIKKGDATYNTLKTYFNTQGIPEYIWWPIVKQESGGNTTAVGDQGTSYGLFQIHYTSPVSPMKKQQLFNPLYNAQTAVNLWKHRPENPADFAKKYAKPGTPEYVAYYWIAAQRPAAWTQFQKTKTFNADMQRIAQITAQEMGAGATWTGGQETGSIVSDEQYLLTGVSGEGGIMGIWNDIKSFFTTENMLNYGVLIAAAIAFILVIYSMSTTGGK
jgi:hypothetical protein